MRHLGRQRDAGGGVGDAWRARDPVQNSLKVGVGTGYDSSKQVAAARDGVHFEDLGDRCELTPDLLVPGLGDLEGEECRDGETECRRIDLGTPADDDTSCDELLQSGLDRSAGQMESTARLEHTDPWLDGEQIEDGGIRCVDGRGIGHLDHSLPCFLHDLTSSSTIALAHGHAMFVTTARVAR